MKPPIYLDYNATTPVDQRVLTRLLPYFSERFGNAASRDHPLGWDAAEAVEEARGHVADLINAQPQEIFFTSGATESICCALKRVTTVKKPNRLITCLTEHQAVLETCHALEKSGLIQADYLPVDDAGRVERHALATCLEPGAAVLARWSAIMKSVPSTPCERLPRWPVPAASAFFPISPKPSAGFLSTFTQRASI